MSIVGFFLFFYLLDLSEQMRRDEKQVRRNTMDRIVSTWLRDSMSPIFSVCTPNFRDRREKSPFLQTTRPCLVCMKLKLTQRCS